MRYILSWDIKEMFKALDAILDNDKSALVEYFGQEYWDKLVEESDKNIEVAENWVKQVLKNNLKATYQLLEVIKDETKDNHTVQERLKAIGL